MAQTLFEKIWEQHSVDRLADGSGLIYIDRVFMHERTGSIALLGLEERQRKIRNPNHVFCTMDHIINTLPGRGDDTLMPGGTDFITTTRQASQRAKIKLFDVNDSDQGISHLVSAEQGITVPGLTVVCPDSHTCTLGALGALAWGIGSSDCEHALATETLRTEKPGQMRVRFNGSLSFGITAKDMILFLINRYGTAGGQGMIVEFAGSAVEALEMEERFTLCNMATEFSAFSAIIAPDQKTVEYVKGRNYAPSGDSWDLAVSHWSRLKTDQGAKFDREIDIDCSDIKPMISWGTSPEHSIAIGSPLPQQSVKTKQSFHYMGLTPGSTLQGTKIDGAFIGSCTNGRLSDLQAAADILKGNKVHQDVTAICTPGSASVKKAAESLGIDKVFINAGFEWREPGCSLCFYAGGEGFGDKERVVSTTNRNFEGRQGRGARTHICSPAMVAAAAIAGEIVDCRSPLPAENHAQKLASL